MTTDDPKGWLAARAQRVPVDDPAAAASFDLVGPLGTPTPAVVGLGVSVRSSGALVGGVHTALRGLVGRGVVRAVSVEGARDTAADLDRYVTTGAGDPRALLAASQSFLRFSEPLAIVRWLRAVNETRPDDPVRIVHDHRPAPTPQTLAEVEDALADQVLAWHERTGDAVAHWGGIAHTVVGDPRTVHPGDPPPSGRNAGRRWRAALGDGYVAVALTLRRSPALGLPPTPVSFTEAPLAALPDPVSFVPVRSAGPLDGPAASWLSTPLRTRCLGPAYDPHRDAEHRVEAGPVAGAVDAFLHAQDSEGLRPW